MNNQVKCPNCGTQFGVEEMLSRTMRKQFEEEFENKLQTEIGQIEQRTKKLEEEKKAFEEKKKKENQLFQERLDRQREEIRKEEQIRFEELRKKNREEVERHKDQVEKEIAEAKRSEYERQLKFKEEQLAEQRAKTQKLQDTQIELEKLKSAMDEQKKNHELEMERRVQKELKEYEEAVSDRERQKVELQIAEKDKQLQDQRKLIQELQRKAEQGSQQLQGEVMEIELESAIQAQFPFDIIEEVPKGIRGADIIQKVRNNTQQEAGIIVYESKRTKSFSKDWVTKLKDDMLRVKADIGLIVTEAMPDDMRKFGQVDGIWVCHYSEFSSVAYILREMILRLNRVKSGEVNRTEKMSILYDYIRSNEFVQRMQNILDDFKRMKDHLDREKRAYTKIWAEREKQIESVMANSLEIYGAIKGISGDGLTGIDELEIDMLGEGE